MQNAIWCLYSHKAEIMILQNKVYWFCNKQMIVCGTRGQVERNEGTGTSFKCNFIYKLSLFSPILIIYYAVLKNKTKNQPFQAQW